MLSRLSGGFFGSRRFSRGFRRRSGSGFFQSGSFFSFSVGALLGFLLRSRFLRFFRDLRRFAQTVLRQDLGNAFRRLCADAQPMLDALGVQRHASFVARRQSRVIGAQLFQVSAVARLAAVGGNQVVEGFVRRPAAGHTNGQHGVVSLVFVKVRIVYFPSENQIPDGEFLFCPSCRNASSCPAWIDAVSEAG